MPKPSVPAVLSVDFSKVEARREGGGKAVHVPEGDYLVQVVGCEQRHKKDDETSKYLSWRLKIIRPEKYASKSGVIYFTTSLKEEALWNLRNFLEDLGLKVPSSSVKIPIAKIVENKMVLGVTLEDDEYNEKVKSSVAATFKKSEFEDTGEEEEEEESEEEETESESDDEDLEELDVEDL